VVGYAGRHGVPAWLVATALVALLIGALNVAIVTLAKPASDQMACLPDLGAAIKEKLHILDSPFASFRELQTALGIAFWAWLWGPLGAFLATPILIVARVALDHLYPRPTPELLP
jgi:predicted PurR-regulated permease PerM